MWELRVIEEDGGTSDVVLYVCLGYDLCELENIGLLLLFFLMAIRL